MAHLKPVEGWMKCAHHRIWPKILKCHTVRDNLEWHAEHSPGADVTRPGPNFGLHFSPATQMAKPLSASVPPSIKWEWQQWLPNWVAGKLNQFSSVKHLLPGSSDHRNVYCTSKEKLSCQLGVTETKGILGMSSHPKWKSEALLNTPTNSCVDFWKCGNSEDWCLACASCKELPNQAGHRSISPSQPCPACLTHIIRLQKTHTALDSYLYVESEQANMTCSVKIKSDLLLFPNTSATNSKEFWCVCVRACARTHMLDSKCQSFNLNLHRFPKSKSLKSKLSWNLEFGECHHTDAQWSFRFWICKLQMLEMAEESSDRQKGIHWPGISHKTIYIYFFF